MMRSDEKTESAWPPHRILLWCVLASATVAWQEQNWRKAVYPAPNYYWDFLQEWLSARSFFAGSPVYSPQVEAMFVHTGERPEHGADLLFWNGHPPASILLALPFGRLSYPDAHFAWAMMMMVLFLLGLAVALRLREQSFSAFDLLPLFALLAVSYPLLQQTIQGQMNGLLVFLAVIAWWADRRDNQWLAGACIGAAAAFKLFPAFLFLYWLMQRKWKALVAGLVAFLLLNAAACALFGFEAFRTYCSEVVPSVIRYRGSWGNLSLSGLWLRLFNPEELEQVALLPSMAAVIPWIRAPRLANVLIWGSQAAVSVLAAIRCYQARTRVERDRAFGLTVMAMLLVAPLTWCHYLVFLLIPLSVKGIVPPHGIARAAFFISAAALWAPLTLFLLIAMGSKVVFANAHSAPPARPWQCLFGMSIQTFALLVLFCIGWHSFRDSSESSPNQSGKLD